jgi:phosphoribosylanthranilate isomerase
VIKIKICGINGIQEALAAAEAGADYLGFVFAPSRRRISQEQATLTIRTLKQLGINILTAGVFVNSSPEEVNTIADKSGLDWIQLSGEENWEYCRKIEKPIIKVIHVTESSDASCILQEIQTGYQLLPAERLIFLLDTGIKGTHGGTGQTFNWNLAKTVCKTQPVFIAGGLTPDNVQDLISTVHPAGVDVSSGVETEGKKDIQKIRAFIKAVRSSIGGNI